MANKHITFKSGETSIKCEEGSDIKITSVGGFSSIETEYQTIDNVFMPGTHTNLIRDKERIITVSMIVPKERRDFYLNFFRVNSTGILTVLWSKSERFIDYIVSKNDVEQPTIKHDPVFNLTLRCNYPYFKDVDGFGENLGAKIPLIAAPFVFLIDKPIISDYAKFDRQYAINNTGEIPVGLYVRIKTLGTTKNPKIMLTDKASAFIRVGTTNNPVILEKNDVLEISTVIENGNTPTSGKDIFVLLNGVNILNKTDQLSSFFQIEPGKHKISYEADDGAENMQVYLWRNWAWSWV